MQQKPIIDDRKFKQYCKYEGIIQKKSKIKSYQNRHFAIRDNGNLLVYYKKNETSNKMSVPKGFIFIGGIEIENKDPNSKEFVLKLLKKVFQLRALTTQDKYNWIKTLTYLKNYLTQSPDHKEKVEEYMKNANLGINKYWKKIDSEHLTKIKLEDEKIHVDDQVEDQKMLNYQLLDIKGISEYTDQIEKSLIDERLVSGFLWYKKDQIGQKLIQSKQRWLFLLAKNSVYSNDTVSETDLDSHEYIDQTKLPPWMDLNTIYYFTFDEHDINNDNSEKKGQISPEQIVSVKQHEVKQRNKNFLKKGFKEFQYGFELKIKNQEGKTQTINYFSEYITDINQWVAAIRKIQNEYIKSLEIQKNKEEEPINEQINSDEEENNIKNKNKKQNNNSSSGTESSSVDSEEDSDLYNDSDELYQQNEEWRKEIIQEDIVKQDRLLKRLKSQQILQLKRQMIILFKDEKRITNQSQYMILKDIIEVQDVDKKHKFTIKNNKGQEWKLECKSHEQQKDWIYLINLIKNNQDIEIEHIFPDNQEKTQKILNLNENHVQSNNLLNTDQNLQNEDDIEQGNNQRSKSLYTKYLIAKKQTEDPHFKIQRTESYMKQFIIEEQEESFFKKLLCCGCCQKKRKQNNNNPTNNKNKNFDINQQRTQPLLDE